MISFGLFLAMLAIVLPATVWVMALAARGVGSTRGRFWPAMGVWAVLLLVDIAFLAIASAVAKPPSAADGHSDAAAAVPPWVVPAVISVLQLAADFVVIRRGFRLSTGRAFAPFGALLGMSVATATVMLVVVRPYLVEGFVLPTGSMAPTLVAGDHPVANKVVKPRRWDIVVYRNTFRPKAEIFCKRVVALPGETLVFDGRGGVTVNGVPVQVPPVLAGRCHATLSGKLYSGTKYVDGEAIRLSDRQVFLMGDNVELSWDSRMDGPSDISAIIGVVDGVYWPPSHMRVMGW